MWRALCVVVLLPAFAAAQTESATETQASAPQAGTAQTAIPPITPPSMPGTQPVHTKGVAYKAFTRYNQFRQGRSEKVAIELTTQGFVTVPNSPVAGIVPIKLELQAEPGFTFGEVQYPKARKYQWSFRPEPTPATSIGWWSPIQFNLKTSKTVALGEHTLKGTLTFQAVGNTGVSEVQTVDVQIPVTVAEHDAKVRKADYPYTGMNPGLIVLLVVLSPVLLAAALVFYPICWAVGPQKCPD